MISTNLALATAGAFCWAAAPLGAVIVGWAFELGCTLVTKLHVHLPVGLLPPNRFITTTAAQFYPSKQRVKPSLQPPFASRCSIATALKLRLQVCLTLRYPN